MVFGFLFCLVACGGREHKREIPKALQYKAARILPVFLSVRWLDRTQASKKGAPPGLKPNTWVRGHVAETMVSGANDTRRQVLSIITQERPPRKLGVEIPGSIKQSLFVKVGDEVSVAISTPDEDLPVSTGSTTISMIRESDGSSLHVLHGRTKLPEPFPREFRLVLGKRKVGQFVLSSRALCERSYDRFAVGLSFLGEDKELFVMPGETTHWTRDNKDEVYLQLRDCRRAQGGSCGDMTRGSWDCQVMVEVHAVPR